MAPRLVIFSGGTAVNSFATQLAGRNQCTTHVLPVSDDGGSTKAILDVLGGTAVGDIRSRCLKLAEAGASEEAKAVSRLLGHRLGRDGREPRAEFLSILDGTPEPGIGLWAGISSPYRDTIRAFLLAFHHEVMRRCRPGAGEPTFEFANGSIGNFFFAGARLFFRSLDAAIFTYCRVSGVSHESSVLPIIRGNGERRIAMGTTLRDGTFIAGQSNLSHPPEDGKSTIVSKEAPPLPSRVQQVCYLSSEVVDAAAAATTKASEAAKVEYEAHPLVLQKLRECDAVVYGCGSLYTSLAISLIVGGVGTSIAALPPSVPRVLMLNGIARDRETDGLTALDVVQVVVDALNQSLGKSSPALPPSRYVSVLLYPAGCTFDIDQEALRTLGIDCREVSALPGKMPYYHPSAVIDVLEELVPARGEKRRRDT